jgi:cytochrome oxidase Cu insertion factor (SCO1/SenC/PrrC family)
LSGDAQNKRRNRLILVGLFAIAFVPLFAAYLLFQVSRSAEPWATTNRGELMSPIVLVADLGLKAADPAVSMNDTGSWWLVTVSNGACDLDCQKALHQLRQLHVLLGKDAGRVKRALVELGSTGPDASLMQNYTEVAWFSAPEQALRSGVYIVDPLGNVVLRYSYGDAGKPVLGDLKQLLKVSHIG